MNGAGEQAAGAHPTLTPGMRVRLAHPGPLLTLRSDLGTLIRPDEEYGDLGYWIVRLDQPALFDDRVGEIEELQELLEMDDNLELLAEERGSPGEHGRG